MGYRAISVGLTVSMALWVAAPLRAELTITVWLNGDKPYRALEKLGQQFELETGVRVIVEHPENPTDKFVQAAQAGKGPDVFIWAHDRLGEFASAGLIVPVRPTPSLKSQIYESAWRGVQHQGRFWGYPIAIECVGLIYNRQLVPVAPESLEEIVSLHHSLRAAGKRTIMWDYANAYFSWGLLAAGDGYVFGQDAQGNYDVKEVGVNRPGVVSSLAALCELIRQEVLPKGTSYSVMERTMTEGNLGMMISGPWAWEVLRKANIDFGVAPLPDVQGRRARPFLGILAAMVNRNSPNADLCIEFIEGTILTRDGLDTLNRDVAIGVPALISFAEELAADPHVRGTLENVKRGEPMPNIPQMGRFWSAISPAITTATNGQVTPQEALDTAARQMKQ